jgi:hypothetical protein
MFIRSCGHSFTSSPTPFLYVFSLLTTFIGFYLRAPGSCEWRFLVFLSLFSPFNFFSVSGSVSGENAVLSLRAVLERVLFVCHSLAFLLFFLCCFYVVARSVGYHYWVVVFLTAFATSVSRCSRRVVCCFSYACARRVFGLVYGGGGLELGCMLERAGKVVIVRGGWWSIESLFSLISFDGWGYIVAGHQ